MGRASSKPKPTPDARTLLVTPSPDVRAGMMELWDTVEATKGLPAEVKTISASAAAAGFRVFLMPIDACKTILQARPARPHARGPSQLLPAVQCAVHKSVGGGGAGVGREWGGGKARLLSPASDVPQHLCGRQSLVPGSRQALSSE